jgi:hypothetical protein
VSDLGIVGLQDLTRRRFKELLNITEVRKIEDGDKIDVDNLTAFFTGDLDELFKEDKTLHIKRSKICILMDGSGSMGSGLLDHAQRKKTVAESVRALIQILEEVQAEEGLNVDYDVISFDDTHHDLRKDNWENEYFAHSGGTNLLGAFQYAHQKLLNDNEIDGKKMIVIFTDGDVSQYEIDDMKRDIYKHNADARAMVIGVGAEIDGHLVKEVVGDHNILARECADVVLMETVMDMME